MGVAAPADVAARLSLLESVLRTIKTIDAVYDAYRLVPGKVV